MIRGEAPGFHLLPGRRGRRLVYSPWRSRFRVLGSAPSAWGSRNPKGVGELGERARGAETRLAPHVEWRGCGEDGEGAGGARAEGGEVAGAAARLGQKSQGFTASAGGRAEWGTACPVITSLSGPPSPPTEVFISTIDAGFQVHFLS